MEAKDLWQIARTLYAMEMKRKRPPIADLMNNERYQRTMTDEYPFRKPSRPGFRRVSPEQKREWEKFSNRGK